MVDKEGDGQHENATENQCFTPDRLIFHKMNVIPGMSCTFATPMSSFSASHILSPALPSVFRVVLWLSSLSFRRSMFSHVIVSVVQYYVNWNFSGITLLNAVGFVCLGESFGGNWWQHFSAAMRKSILTQGIIWCNSTNQSSFRWYRYDWLFLP